MKKLIKLVILFLGLILSFTTNAQEIKISFEVKISGKGKQAIVFIPGFACSGEVWNETKSEFENNFTCYTLTMPGFASAKPQQNPTFKKWETEIANFIIQNKITKPIIIGHSMGGGLALAIAADYPDLISKIVVVDALPCLFALMNPSFKSKVIPDCTEMNLKLMNTSNEDFYKMQKKSISSLLADDTKQEMVVNWSVQSDRKTFAELYCDFGNTDLSEKIATIKCPSLILLESYFANFKPAIENQYKNLKTANLKYATKGLHFIMFDDKDWYINELKSFLN